MTVSFSLLWNHEHKSKKKQKRTNESLITREPNQPREETLGDPLSSWENEGATGKPRAEGKEKETLMYEPELLFKEKENLKDILLINRTGLSFAKKKIQKKRFWAWGLISPYQKIQLSFLGQDL